LATTVACVVKHIGAVTSTENETIGQYKTQSKPVRLRNYLM